MEKMLVTGGAGFIGSCFVRRQLAHGGSRIVVLDKLTYAGHLENLAEVRHHPQLCFQQGDIADGNLVGRLLEEHSPMHVVNFAAESHVDRSIDQPMAFVQTNVVGTCQLLEASLRYWGGLPPSARDRFRFLHVSTDEVFGTLEIEGRFSERTPYAPHSPYAASKAAADHFARAYFHTYGLPTIITNCTNNYGPYQYPEKLIPLMVRRALEGKSLPVYGDGSNVRDWLHVEDHCRGLEAVLAAGTPGEAYLFGGLCERSNLTVVRSICEILDAFRPRDDKTSYFGQVGFVEDRLGHDFRYAIDTDKVRRELAWTPQVDFRAGLRETVQWYLEHAAWVERVTQDVYDGQRLGLRPE